VLVGDGTDVISRALELADLPGIALTDLTDTPDDLSAYAGKYAHVSEDGLAIEFSEVDTELPESPEFAGTVTIRGNLHLDGDITNYNAQLPDIGAVQNSDRRGYGLNYVTNKTLSNCLIGFQSMSENGGVKIAKLVDKTHRFQVYLDGEWKTILSGVDIVTDDSENPKDIEFTDFEPYAISLITGDSDLKDINGLPLIQGMTTSMGAIQYPQTVDGGEF
jgi:hypothetical protein